MGLAVALKAFAAAVLGGFGSIPGALVGGIIDRPDRALRRRHAAGGLQGYGAVYRAPGHARGAPAGPVRDARPQEGVGASDAFPVQDRLRAGHPPLPRPHQRPLVRRPCHRRPRASGAAVGLLCGRDHLGFHLRHLRRLAHGAGGLYRAGLARPRRLPRHRRLCARLLSPAWHALGGVRRAGHADHHGLRHHRRLAGVAHDRHLPRHRHPSLLGHHPGGFHALGVGDARVRRHGRRETRHFRLCIHRQHRVLLSVRGRAGPDPVADRAISCARLPAGPGSPFATARSPRSRWASTWRSTSPSPSPTRRR